MPTGRRDFDRLVRFSVVLTIMALAAIVLLAPRARANYDGPTTPEIEAWFKTVRNGAGQYCCDGTEVVHVTDYQWQGDHFDVVADGVTYHAAGKQITTEPNRLGEPLLWFYPVRDEHGAPIPRSDANLRCFMRGREG